MKRKTISLLAALALCLTMIGGAFSAAATKLADILPEDSEVANGAVYLKFGEDQYLDPSTKIPSGATLNIQFEAGLYGEVKPFTDIELTDEDKAAVYEVQLTLEEMLELDEEAADELEVALLYDDAATGTFVWQPTDGFHFLIVVLDTSKGILVNAVLEYVGPRDLEEGGEVSCYPFARYTGKPVELPHTVAFLFDGALKQGTDYTVEYENNTELGTATLTITGIGDYTGTLTVTFKIVKPAAQFTDVSEKAWYYDAVSFAKLYRLFEGTSKTTFEPETQMTRAMFVSVLSRIAGIPVDNSQPTVFSDVPTGQWYTGAVAWASECEIVVGSDGKFMPNDPITREQICRVLTEFVDYLGVTLKEINKAVKFKDEQDISKWAKADVALMQVAGIVSGSTDGKFYPKKAASRAEVAQMLKGFVENYLEIGYDEETDEIFFWAIYEDE